MATGSQACGVPHHPRTLEPLLTVPAKGESHGLLRRHEALPDEHPLPQAAALIALGAAQYALLSLAPELCSRTSAVRAEDSRVLGPENHAPLSSKDVHVPLEDHGG